MHSCYSNKVIVVAVVTVVVTAAAIIIIFKRYVLPKAKTGICFGAQTLLLFLQ
jgi:hypothetical protein